MKAIPNHMIFSQQAIHNVQKAIHNEATLRQIFYFIVFKIKNQKLNFKTQN